MKNNKTTDRFNKKHEPPTDEELIEAIKTHPMTNVFHAGDLPHIDPISNLKVTIQETQAMIEWVCDGIKSEIWIYPSSDKTIKWDHRAKPVKGIGE